MVCLVLRVGALLLERGVAGVSRGCFGLGARCARSVFRLLTLRAFPPDPPKALSGLRSLRSRTAYGVPKGRGRSAREKLQGSVSRLANSRQLRSHKAVSCRGFATASRVCRLTESLWRLNYSAGTIGGRSLRPRCAPASLPIKRCLAAATPPQGSFVGSAPLARGNLSTPRRGTMPPPFGLPTLRVNHARLSRSVGGLRGCFLSSLPLDSILRAFFVCSVLPHGARANYSAAALHLARCANGRRCAPRRGWVARALGSALGAPTPRGSPRATPGERLSLRSVFVGSRQPPTIRGTRHGRCVPRLQGAAALHGRVSGGWRLGRASARARFSLGGLPLLSVAGRLWGAPGSATLRSGHPIGLLPCGRPPRARRGRRTPLSSRRRPKRFCPLEPLTPHAACARTRPPDGRPLPRLRGLAPRGSVAAVGSLSD